MISVILLIFYDPHSLFMTVSNRCILKYYKALYSFTADVLALALRRCYVLAPKVLGALHCFYGQRARVAMNLLYSPSSCM